jgi:hypothetical protein
MKKKGYHPRYGYMFQINIYLISLISLNSIDKDIDHRIELKYSEVSNL